MGIMKKKPRVREELGVFSFDRYLNNRSIHPLVLSNNLQLNCVQSAQAFCVPLSQNSIFYGSIYITPQLNPFLWIQPLAHLHTII